MKYFLLFLLSIAFFTTNAQVDGATKLPKVTEQIIYLSDKYESIQAYKNEMLQKHRPESQEIKDIEVRLNDQKSVNYAAAQKIMDTHGFPDSDLVGAEATHKFWMIVQHLDKYPKFQSQVLRQMDRAVTDGKAEKVDFAYLYDRICINEGRSQHYGTQYFYDAESGTYKLHPTDNIEHTNAERAELGLSSVEAYLAETNEKYKGTIQRTKPEVSHPSNL